MFCLTPEFDFDLPDELIAQEPPPSRRQPAHGDRSRRAAAVTHLQFNDLPSLLRAGDLLVVNDTRVFPARFIGTRLPSRSR